MRGYSLPLQTLRLVKLLRLLVQVRADCLLPTASLSPTAARGGFSALVRHPQPDLNGGLKGLPARPLEKCRHIRPWAPPVPLLFTSILYHEYREKSTGNITQKIQMKKCRICIYCTIPLAWAAGERLKKGVRSWWTPSFYTGTTSPV